MHGAAFGVAGAVTGRRFRTTNLHWEIDQDALERALGARTALVNDLEAAAHGTLVMPPGSTAVLQEGRTQPGNRAIIAAGTGLGEAMLFALGDDHYPSPSEGGHTSFAPLDEEDLELWRFARRRYGHVSYERVLSGPGIVLLHEFYRERMGHGPGLAAARDEDPAAAVSRAATGGDDPAARAALRRFARLYGAEAGNLALKTLALGGVYVAGGIAPKILPFLTTGEFCDAFADKGRYRALLSQIRIEVVLDELLGLRGAARVASRL